MKIIISIIRVIVGLLFIFSGLVKAIDPLGLSYKMNEFFAKWNWDWAPPFSLSISVIMIAFEIFAGVALLLGWKPKLVTRLLLLLIIFFTILTGYAYLSGKFHSCGCFGDCIPITSGVSFAKDLALLVLIIILYVVYKRIGPVFAGRTITVLLGLATAGSLALMAYVLMYLPVKDCLPYAVGKNMLVQMAPPPGSLPDSIEIYYRYTKNGKELSFDSNHFPDDFDDSSYQFVGREDRIIRKGNAVPAIIDFLLKTAAGADTTKEVLSAKGKYVLFFARDFDGSAPAWEADFASVNAACISKNIPLLLVSNRSNKVEEYFNTIRHYNRVVLTCDETPMKSFLRAKTGVVLMDGAVIVDKRNIRDAMKGITGRL